MKHLLLSFCVFIAFTSCRKSGPLFDGQSCSGNCYILTGRLSEFQTNQPLSDIELKFYYRPSGNPIIFDPTQFLGSAKTAFDGSYSFKFDSKNYKNPTGYFRIEGFKDGYIYGNAGDKIDKDLLFFDLDSNKINIPQINNLVLFKAATIKFNIKATTITNFSFLTIGYRYGTNGYGPVLRGGQVIDTTLIYQTASDIPTYINWSALGNGVNIRKNDTLIVPFGTVKEYQIDL